MVIKIKREAGCEDIDMPKYQKPGDAGADLCAAIPYPIPIHPGERLLVRCGFSMELPDGYEAQIRPRSGLALNHGLTVLNSPGTIDAGYRGTVGVLLYNSSNTLVTITRNMRIAQMVIAPAVRAVFETADALVSSDRGEGGFGHTGH